MVSPPMNSYSLPSIEMNSPDSIAFPLLRLVAFPAQAILKPICRIHAKTNKADQQRPLGGLILRRLLDKPDLAMLLKSPQNCLDKEWLGR
jgi:hypothetical protein